MTDEPGDDRVRFVPRGRFPPVVYRETMEVLVEARIRVEAGKVTGGIDTHIYGHFIENMARCIYGGLLRNLRPGDPRGPWEIRERVVSWIRRLSPPVIRWPGGLYADGYQWKDGVGRVGDRPLVRNRYWSRFGPFTRVLDPNWFGTDEYMAFIEEVGAEAYVNVNVGTGTPGEAAEWAEYMVGDSEETRFGAMRAELGRREPYEIRYWGLGNELYGPWALGRTTPERYGKTYLDFREAIREKEPGAACVAVGADYYMNPNWNGRLLTVIGDRLELLSFHVYLPGMENMAPYIRRMARDREGCYYAIAGAAREVEDRIEWMEKSVDDALGRDSGVGLAMDEWNLWWKPSQLLFPGYTLRDALFVCGVFHAMHRHSRRLVLANIAQLVNVLGLIRAYGERSYRTALYYPFLLYAGLTGPQVVAVDWDSGYVSAPPVGAISGRDKLEILDCSATLSEEGRELVLFVINRHVREGVKTRIEISGFEPLAEATLFRLNGPHPGARNSFGDDEVVSMNAREMRADAMLEKHVFPPHSVTAIRLRSKAEED